MSRIAILAGHDVLVDQNVTEMDAILLDNHHFPTHSGLRLLLFFLCIPTITLFLLISIQQELGRVKKTAAFETLVIGSCKSGRLGWLRLLEVRRVSSVGNDLVHDSLIDSPYDSLALILVAGWLSTLNISYFFNNLLLLSRPTLNDR